MEIKRYKKRPKTVEAIQFTGSNHDQIQEMTGARFQNNGQVIFVSTINMIRERVRETDFVIKHAPYAFSVMTQAQFKETYEEIS